MQNSNHHIVIIRDAHKWYPRERPLFQVERLSDQPGHNFMSSRFRIRLTAHVGDRRREFHVSNKLEGPAFNFAKNRTQDLMTLRNNVQALLEELNIELSFETKTIADVVRGCIWFQLLDKPQRRLISRCRPG